MLHHLNAVTDLLIVARCERHESRVVGPQTGVARYPRWCQFGHRDETLVVSVGPVGSVHPVHAVQAHTIGRSDAVGAFGRSGRSLSRDHHPVRSGYGRDVPVGCWAAGGASKVQPRLTVRSGSVGHPSARLSCIHPLHPLHLTIGSLCRKSGLMPMRRWSHGEWRAIAVGHEWTLRAVYFGESIDVLELRTTEMSLIPSSTATAATTSISSSTISTTTTAATSSASSTSVLGEGSVFAGELGLNPLAVGRVADGREDGPDAVDEDHALLYLTVVEDGLDHVVAVAVSQELFQTWTIEHLGDQAFSSLGVSHSDAFLDDIRRESVTRESAKVQAEYVATDF